MPKLTEADLPKIQAAVVPIFEKWAVAHSDGTIMNLRPYDPQDINQRIENVRIEPSPDISVETASFIGRSAVGDEIYDGLLAGLHSQGAVDLAVERSNQHQNTLYATLHLHDVRDTGVTHNSVYVASGGEQKVADMNDMIVNPMVAYLNFGERAAYEILRAAGGVDEMLPYEAAGRYGMEDRGLRLFLMETMQKSLLKRLNEGVAIHWALSGTRAVEVELKNGTVLAVPRVSKSIAEFAIKNIGYAVPVPMNLDQNNRKIEVLPKKRLKKIDDVDQMMEEMVEAVSQETGQRVIYGVPEDAETA